MFDWNDTETEEYRVISDFNGKWGIQYPLLHGSTNISFDEVEAIIKEMQERFNIDKKDIKIYSYVWNVSPGPFKF